MRAFGAIGVPECAARQRAPPETTADWPRTIPQPPGRLRRRQLVSSRIGDGVAGILLITAMVRSVLLRVQGHETRSYADLTDRDRDESSRRAISAWVRTNPQTQVR
jgi:hypothetical protein